MEVVMTSSLSLLVVFFIPGVWSVKPNLDNTVVNYTVVEGRTAILPCTVSNLGRHKVKVVWVDQWNTVLTFNNLSIIDDERIKISRHHNDEWNLQFDKVKYGDQGLYTCQINTTPPLLQSVMLSVVVPPRISTGNSEGTITVREGDRATLTCNATGIPRPTVTWYRQPNLRGDSRESESCEATSRIGFTGEILVIHNVTRYCGGNYECVAENGVPPSIRRTTLVRVKFHPEVSLANKRMGQSLGKDTILECIVTAYPQAEAAWMFQGRQLSNSKKYKLDIYNHDNDNSKLTLSLVIKNIEPHDYGLYTCMASNDMGKASEKMILHEHKERTKKPTAATTTTISTTTVSRHIIDRTFKPQRKLDRQNLAHIPGRAGVGQGRHGVINTDRQRDRYTPKQSQPEASLHAGEENSATKVMTSATTLILIFTSFAQIIKAVVF